MSSPPADKLSEYRIVDVIRKATMDTGEVFSDGKGRSRWQRFKAFWAKCWNLIWHGALYDSRVEFKALMMDAKLGDIKTLCNVYAVAVWNGDSKSVCFSNKPDSSLLEPNHVPQDAYVDASHIPCWMLASYTSRIPFFFYVPVEIIKDNDGKFLNYGVYWVDGAIASMAPHENYTHPHHVIVSVCDSLQVEPDKDLAGRTFKNNWKTRLPFFIGSLYSSKEALWHMYSDKALDQENNFLLNIRENQIKKLCEVPTMQLRGDWSPSWIDFSNHTKGIVDRHFEISYEWGKDWVKNNFTEEEKKIIAGYYKHYPDEASEEHQKIHQTGIAFTGGATLGYNQAPVHAAIWQMVLDTQVEYGLPLEPPFNSFSGNSVGAIQSMFFAWLQDMYYDFEGDGREKLVKMMERE